MDSCRTCLRTSIGPDWHDLFDSQLQPVTDILNASTSLNISRDDGLPGSVCNDCHEQLISFHAFCLLTIKSDQIHRHKVLHVKQERHENESKSWAQASTDDDPIPITPQPEETDYTNEYKHEYPPFLPKPQNPDCTAGDLPVDVDSNRVDCGQPQQDDGLFDRNDNNSDADIDANEPAECPDDRARSKPANPPRYVCDLCGEQFAHKYLIEGHLRTHRGLQPFACFACEQQFDEYGKLQRHRDRQHGHGGGGGGDGEVKAERTDTAEQKRFVCEYADCGKNYKNRRSINEHINRVHLGIKKCVESICEMCGKSFQTRPNLMQHMKTHMDIEQYPYQCDICQKRFNVQYSFKIHMMRHNNIRNFPCPMCPSRMCTKPELDNHVANHNREVPWPCAECPSVFNRKASMQRHVLKVHRGHKPYVCTECGRAFGKKWTLKNHVMRHTGEKPHACPVCDRRFVQLVTLKTHMKMHNK